jgi:cephalosporin-C deacetylase
VFPREQGRTVAVPIEHRQDKSQGARFVTPQGPSFETYHRTWLDHRDGGRNWGTFRYPDGLTMRFKPLAAPRPTDMLKLDFVDLPERHFFDDSRIRIAVKAHNQGPEPVEVELALALETYEPNHPGKLIERQSETVRIPRNDTAEFAVTFDRVEAGPYEFVAEALHDDGSRVARRGALLHQREAWADSLPDLEPDDFDAFWASTLEAMRSRPLNATITEPEDRRGVADEFRLVSFNGLGDTRVHGFLALPQGASKDNPVPVRIGYPGAGYGAAPLSRDDLHRGWAYLSLTIHDLPLAGGESGRHHPREFWSDEPYQGLGRSHRDTFFYRTAYANAVRAVDFVASLPEIDADRIVVSGGSQGGSLAIAVAALEPRVALAIAEVPGRVRWDLLTWKWRANCSFTPPEGVSAEQMFEQALAYHDIAYMARRVRVPIVCLVSLGDEINPGPLQWLAYHELPPHTYKMLRVATFAGHGGGPYPDPDPLLLMFERYVTSSR